MKRSLPFCFVVMFGTLVASTLFAQPPGGPGGPPGGFGGPGGGGPFGGGGGLMGLAMREEVQQELQLVDEQKEKVRTIVEDMGEKARAEMRDMFSNMRDLSDEERRERFAEVRSKFEALNADVEKELGKVLLPHQLDRLKQINLQTQMRQRGATALTSGELAKTLNLTDEQREKLEQRAAEVQQELQEKYRELQADARKKVLEVLTEDQRAQLEKLMGDQFDMPEPRFDFRSRFGRGGRDGRDGDRRGGQPGGEERSRSQNESI
jgi:hypothetical protein